MSKSKRSKRPRDMWLDDPLAVANENVRAAEARLLEARRAAAAAAVNGHERRRPAEASPAEQAEEFFNRPGDFYIAQFEVPASTTGAPVRAQCVVKADEAQRDYLLEVMHQIRGGFGDGARISLSRAKQQQQRVVDHEAPPRPVNQPGMDDLAGVSAVHQAAREAARRRADLNTAGGAWGDSIDLTREELQAQLPGMTRREVAAELGVDPADIGGDIKNADTIEVEQLAAELGLSPLDLQPIKMSGGGYVYAVKPRHAPPAPGRHARPEQDSGEHSERER